MAGPRNPNGNWEGMLHAMSGRHFILSPEQSTLLLERLQGVVKPENISKWAPRWPGGGYAGVEIRCSNPASRIPYSIRKHFGGDVKLWTYDDYLTVFGGFTNVLYKAAGLEDFLLDLARGEEDVEEMNKLKAMIHEEIEWRKNPDAPR